MPKERKATPIDRIVLPSLSVATTPKTQPGQADPHRKSAQPGNAQARSASPGAARRGAVLCLLSAVGFGLAAVLAKQCRLSGISVPSMLTVRFALAAAIFWAVVAWRRPSLPTNRVLGVCIGLGAVGYALQATFYFGALTSIDASLVSLLLYIYPALVMVLALALRRETLTRRRLAALACSIAGLVLLLSTGGGTGPAHLPGVLLALGAAIAYALYLTVADGLPPGLDLYLLSAIVCSSAAISLGAAGWAAGSLHAPTRTSGWFWIALLTLVSTVIPIMCLFAGVRLVGASTAAILSCAEPAVTVTSAALIYNERLTAIQAIGGALVLLAVVVLQWRQKHGAGAIEPDRPLGVDARVPV
jgi:drug/metabolite transporter (DMT)-like permease